MNCANHPDRERSAFCQNCGKPLCSECVRTIGNSILCEPCFTLRNTQPPVPPPAANMYTATNAGPNPGAPNPGLAALLGFIPGVGAMYNGQYAKGIVHLIVFAILVSLSDQNGIFGLFIAGWVFYMVIEAYHTARARRDGTALPNPFGLNDLGDRLGFGRSWPSSGPSAGPYSGPYAGAASGPATPPGTNPAATQGAPYSYDYNYTPPVSNWGAPQDYTAVPVPPPVAPVPPGPQRVPTGAIWLIGLGVLFLLGNTGLFWIRGRFVAPLMLIAIAVWIFVRQMTAGGHGFENDGTPAYSARLRRAIITSMWLAGTGVIWLLDVIGAIPWSRSWPLYLILGGVALLLRRTLGSRTYPGPYGYPPYPPAPVPPPPSPANPGTGMIATPVERRPGEER